VISGFTLQESIVEPIVVWRILLRMRQTRNGSFDFERISFMIA
jgi:hypothetical protein